MLVAPPALGPHDASSADADGLGLPEMRVGALAIDTVMLSLRRAAGGDMLTRLIRAILARLRRDADELEQPDKHLADVVLDGKAGRT